MATHLSRHLKAVRLAKDLRLSHVARLAGYRNVSKGCNRLLLFERTGAIGEVLLQKVIVALEVDHALVRELARRDRQEWEMAALQSEPQLIVGRFARHQIPAYIATLYAAEEFAFATARELCEPVRLVWSRMITIWFDCQGRIERREITSPFVEVGGRKFLLPTF